MRTTRSTVGVIVVILALVLGLAQQAYAALIPSDGTYGIVNARTTKTTYGQFDAVEVNFNWKVPDSAKAGDTMQLQLPAQFKAASFTDFELKDPDTNDVIGTAVTNANGLVTITLTKYVDFHDEVGGTGHFFIQFESTQLNFINGATTIDLFGTPVTVNQEVGPAGPYQTAKHGWWRGSQAEAVALNPDGSLVNPAGPHLTFTVVLPVSDWTTLEVVDELGPNLRFCDNGAALPGHNRWRQSRVTNGGIWQNIHPDINDVVTLTSECAPDDTLILTITKPATLTDYQLRVSFDVSVRTDAEGFPVHLGPNGEYVRGFSPAGYRNDAVIRINGVDTAVSTAVRYQFAGGEGSGLNHPAIDIQKYSGTWAGIDWSQTEPLDADGEPAVLPAGDHDTAPGQAVIAAEPTPLSFMVSNIGNEDLTDLVVSDELLSGVGEVTLVRCELAGQEYLPGDDGAIRISGVLPRKGALRCDAELPALGADAVHADRASVTGVGVHTQTEVNDADDFHAWTDKVTETPTTPSPTAPVTPPASPGSTPTTTTPPATAEQPVKLPTTGH